jgi:hypothetical protein
MRFSSLWALPALLVGAAAAITAHAEAVAGPFLDQRMGWAANYLAEAVTVSGRFTYRRNLSENIDDNRRYNFLRHAGTLYALAHYHTGVPPDKKPAEAMQRAATYLINCCAGPIDGQTDMLAIWSLPELTGRPHQHLQAKLGGAGLALAALIQVEEVLPGTTDPMVLQRLAKFLLFMQKPDGSFYSKYFPGRNGRDDQWTSLYYPGEAALGLVMLYEFDGNGRWLEAAIDALRYLSRIREGPCPLPADHWALIATARLFAQHPAALQTASPAGIPWNRPQDRGSIRAALLDHAVALVESILAEQIHGHPRECLNGGFNADGRTTPTATRLEGLLAALSFLEEGKLRNRTCRAVALGIRFLTEAQITAGPARGGFTRYSPLCSLSATRANEIRIDYVQHALAAMFAYRQLLQTQPPQPCVILALTYECPISHLSLPR